MSGPSERYFLDNADEPVSLTGEVRPPEPECPQERFHGNPFRYCSCGWMETQAHDCTRDGHDYTHVVTGAGELILLHCPECDTRWRVEKV